MASMKITDQKQALYLLEKAEELIQYLLPMAKDSLPTDENSKAINESDILRALKRSQHFREDMKERGL